VAILDSLDAMMDELSASLPAEVKARRQQYDYYRERLLAFEEAVL
jgi:type I restriction enzyme S subunit